MDVKKHAEGWLFGRTESHKGLPPWATAFISPVGTKVQSLNDN